VAAPAPRRAGWSPSDLQALAVGGLAAVAAFVAGLAGCAPVGVHATDVALTALLAAAVTALGARATPLALGIGAAVAAIAGGDVLLRGLGLAAVAGAVLLAVADRRRAGAEGAGPGDSDGGDGPVAGPPAEGRRSAPTERWRPVAGAVVALVVVQVLLRLPFTAPTRGSAAVAALGLLPIAWSGRRHLAPATRRVVRRASWALAAVVAVGLGTGLAAGLGAASSIRDGVRGTDAGVDAVRDGDEEAAHRHFAAAEVDLRDARARTRAWWATPARHLPLVAPQMEALDAVADGGARTAGVAAAGAQRLDADRLRLVDGRLDPEAVAAAGPVLRDVAVRTAALRAELAASDGGDVWRLGPVARAFERFSDAVADAEGSARTGVLAAEVGPALLGRDGVARYLVAFVTPSEARGTGFLGNYGLLTVTDGRLELEEVGRNKDLNAAGPDTKEITGPPDYLARYGRFEPASTWENVTFTPDGPTAAQVMAELYPQSGGVEVDGVIRIDPTGLARLLRLTGPVEVEGLPYPLDATNVVEFLEVEQYRLFAVRQDRIDLLGQAAEATFAALTSGPGPAPARLARTLGPAVRGGHVTLWMRDPAAQALVERLGASGAVPPVRGDGFGVVTQNTGGGKIDAFLQRSIRYTATVDAATGAVEATAEIGLRNEAPGRGEPPYLIGNLVGAPPGTNRMWLSVYSPFELTSASVDGRPLDLERGRELGRNVWSAFVTVGPGETANVTARFAGSVDLSGGRYRFDLLPQVMARPDRVDVVVQARGGALAPRPASPAPPGGLEEVDGGLRASVADARGTFTVVADVRRSDR